MITAARHLKTFAATAVFFLILGPPLLFWSLSMLVLAGPGMLCVVVSEGSNGRTGRTSLL